MSTLCRDEKIDFETFGRGWGDMLFAPFVRNAGQQAAPRPQ